MRLLIISLAAVIALSGCAGSPGDINGKSAEKLVDVDTRTLCGSYGSKNSPFSIGSPSSALKSELERRSIFTADEWKSIDAHEIKPGMSELALLASRGYPDSSSKTETETKVLRHWTMSKISVGERNPQVVLDGDRVVRVSR